MAAANPAGANEAQRAEMSGAAKWSGVWALTLCVATLIASEFMPMSILSPIADDLGVSEGMAGQGIAVSGLFAVLTSLSISSLIAKLDRRRVLLGLTVVMFVSGLIVARAPSYAVFMLGRALIGIVIGGFWSMSAATVMRLVPASDVPRALALLNGGNALATTVAAPLGAFLGQFIGWRGAFLIVVPLAAITFVWQWLVLPAMPPKPSEGSTAGASALGVLRVREARWGMLAIALLFSGQFGLFTYIRPFLEQTTGLGVTALSSVLLAMGLAGLVGTAVIGKAISRSLRATAFVGPLIMAGLAVGLIAFGHLPWGSALLLMGWGLVGTAMPVVWWTWLARALPDDAEAGGGLMVAIIQLSITVGAAGGGLFFDAGGHVATFVASSVLLLAAALVGGLKLRAV